MTPFTDRTEAGRQLAARLAKLALQRPFVLALPRGGVPVAFEVAYRLRVPIDLLPVRKLRLPGNRQVAFGALAPGNVCALTDERLPALAVNSNVMEEVAAEEQRELERCQRVYRGSRPPPLLAGRDVIIVDDGLSTGASMRAAVRAVKKQEAAKVIVAVPAASLNARVQLDEADSVILLREAPPYASTASAYRDYRPVQDMEVMMLMQAARSLSQLAA